MDDPANQRASGPAAGRIRSRLLPSAPHEPGSAEEPPLDLQAVDALRRASPPGTPDLMTELVDMFLEDAPGMLAEIRWAAETRDRGTLERVSHGLKGSCANLGARPMAGACHALEDLARTGALDGAPGLVEALEREYARAAEALRAERR